MRTRGLQRAFLDGEIVKDLNLHWDVAPDVVRSVSMEPDTLNLIEVDEVGAAIAELRGPQ